MAENKNGDGSRPSTSGGSSGSGGGGGGANKALKEQFEAFAKFGDKAADGKTIKLSQSDKWFKQAKVIDGKKITTTDTGIAFKKISKYEDPFVKLICTALKAEVYESEMSNVLLFLSCFLLGKDFFVLKKEKGNNWKA